MFTHHLSRIVVYGIALFGLCHSAVYADELTLEQAHEIIAEVNAGAVAAVAAGDVDAFMLSYADNARVMPNGVPTMTAPEDIRAFWSGLFDAGMRDLVFNTVTLRVAGDLLVEEGTLTFVTGGPDDEPTLNSAKFVVVWHQDADGSWGWGVDIFNSNS